MEDGGVVPGGRGSPPPLLRRLCRALAEAGRYDLVSRTEACNPDAFAHEPGLGVPDVMRL